MRAEQEKRPGQRVRRGLVARADERHDIRANVVLAQALPGLGVRGFQQKRQQVARGGLRLAGREQRAAARDEFGHHAVEEAERRPASQARDAGNPIRRAQHIHRVDPPEAVEIGVDGGGQLVRPRGEAAREDRPLQHIQCDAGHFGGDVHGLAVAPARPAVRQGSRGGRHRRREAFGRARIEERREDAALRAPGLPLHGEQPGAEPGRQDAARQRIAAIIRRIVEQHVADAVGIADHAGRPEYQLDEHDRLAIMRLGPNPERVGHPARTSNPAMPRGRSRGVGAGGGVRNARE